MKKIIILLFCLLLVGCSSEVEFNSSKLLERSEILTEEMRVGNFQSTIDNLADSIKPLLSLEALEEGWHTTIVDIGEYQGLHSVDGKLDNDSYIVSVVLKYETTGIEVFFSYNQDEEIIGIFLTYKAIESELVNNQDYYEIEVILGDKYPIKGILTLPKTDTLTPVVLLVSGSGVQDRNSTIYQNTPFKDIAYGLAENGIATLRYDERLYTYPELVDELGVDLNLETEMLEDISYALQYLENQEKVDSKNIYVLGHSLGGGLTPYIASSNENVAGIISMAGSLKPLYELSYDQNKAIEKEILNGDYDEKTRETIKLQMLQVEKDILTLRGDISNIENDTILMGLPAGYQKSTKKYAGENYVNGINLPILVLQGKADFQVSPTVDYQLWKSTLSNRDNVDFKLYENLNHLMMQSTGKQDITEYQTKGVVDQQVINDITNFIFK